MPWKSNKRLSKERTDQVNRAKRETIYYNLARLVLDTNRTGSRDQWAETQFITNLYLQRDEGVLDGEHFTSLLKLFRSDWRDAVTIATCKNLTQVQPGSANYPTIRDARQSAKRQVNRGFRGSLTPKRRKTTEESRSEFQLDKEALKTEVRDELEQEENRAKYGQASSSSRPPKSAPSKGTGKNKNNNYINNN